MQSQQKDAITTKWCNHGEVSNHGRTSDASTAKIMQWQPNDAITDFRWDVGEMLVKTDNSRITNFKVIWNIKRQCNEMFDDYNYMYNWKVQYDVFPNEHFYRARWSSCSAFRQQIVRSMVRILHWPYTNFLSTINKSSMLHSTKVWNGTLRCCVCNKFDIPGRRVLAAHKTWSEKVSPGWPES